MPALKQTKSGAYRSRQRVPRDVADEYGRLYGQQFEAKLHIPAGTSQGEAKQRHAEWIAEVEGRFKAIRAAQKGEGQSLTPYEARKLAGEWYVWWTARHRETPSLLAEHWRDQVQDALVEAGGTLLERIGDPDEVWSQDEDVRRAVRPVLADVGETAQFLAARGFVLDNAAQASFLDFLYHDLAAAIRLRIKRAAGDYSPDSYSERFPVQQSGNNLQARKGEGLSPSQLFEQWRTERKPAQSTVENWRNFFKAMDEHFEGRNAASIQEAEARLWIKSLVTGKRSAHTVKRTWLKACRSIFKWAVQEQHVPRNPFANVNLTVPQRVVLRENKAFSETEARTILAAAAAIRDTTKATDGAAKRWVPWLCAYTGARPGEVTQLRKEDVVEHDGIWAIRITPEAGSVKTRKARMVPLHEHLLAQGFLDFVRSSERDRLFYKPRKSVDRTDDRKPPGSQVRQRLADWVRGLGVTDKGVNPNHGWRHTFKQVGRRHSITDRVLDFICGHAPATVGRSYGAPTLGDMAKELEKFPRYAV